jgi:Tfp pilus assembly protein PilF
LGKAHLVAGELHEAEKAFHQALKADPDSSRAHGCLALIHNLMDKRSIAAEEFKIAAARARLIIEHQPDSAHAHADLAFVYKAMGDDSAANEERKRAVELGWRTDPDADLFTGLVCVPGTARSGRGIAESRLRAARGPGTDGPRPQCWSCLAQRDLGPNAG